MITCARNVHCKSMRSHLINAIHNGRALVLVIGYGWCSIQKHRSLSFDMAIAIVIWRLRLRYGDCDCDMAIAIEIVRATTDNHGGG